VISFPAKALALLAASAPFWSHAQEADLHLLEKEILRFEAGGTFRSAEEGVQADEDLEKLRSPSIPRAELRRMMSSYAERPSGEVAFRIARHAFLLGEPPDEVERWIGRIAQAPDGGPFVSRGLYLRGVLELKRDRTPAAAAAFAQAAAEEGNEGEVAAEATMALARISFDAGEAAAAQRLYASIPPDTRAHESSLLESAWTQVKMNRPDLAAADVHLLFALYPQSRLLPQAGYLLGEIFEGNRGLKKGMSALDQLAGRFSFEEEATHRALQAFSGKEEEILAEFDPTLGDGSVWATLPPIGRRLLEEHPTVREYLARLRSIRDEQETLKSGSSVVEASRLALTQPEAATIDGVTLLEWCNDLEREALSLPRPPEAVGAAKFDRLRQELNALRMEFQAVEQSASEIERHIPLNWDFLGGERDRQALETQRETRALIRSSRAAARELPLLSSLLDALSIRLRNQEALRSASVMKPLRREGESSGWFQNLDRLRARIVAASAERQRKFARDLPAIESLRERALADSRKETQRLLPEARAKLKGVLQSGREELTGMLTQYRWNIAEARYKYLKSIEKDFALARKNSEKDASSLDERYDPIRVPAIPPPFAPPKSETQEVRDRIVGAETFAALGDAYLREIAATVESEIRKERDRYAKYAETREHELTRERELRREQAILAYQQFSQGPNNDRIPFALYRMAQLHYERANAIGHGRKNPDYSLAIRPLERIVREYPKFPNRDSALYLLAYSQLEAGQKSRSVATFEKLVAEYPLSSLIPEVELRIGEHYFSERAFRRALPHYEAVLSRGFNYFYDKALYKLAWANYMVGKYDSAVAYFLILLDYREVLDPDLRERYIQFSEEATEYVAFSLFRSGGATAARDLFQNVGWKPYALAVLQRMGKIFIDRARFNDALEVYNLALERYATSPGTPDLFENRIKLLERLGRSAEGIAEKRRVLLAFRPSSPWRQINRDDREALLGADRLLDRVTYSLATEYDAHSAESKNRADRKEAMSLYRDVIARNPDSEESYRAHFRLAQIALLEGSSGEAVAEYDAVIRSGRHSEHFSEALYGIVAAREKTISDRGGLDRVVAKAAPAVPSEAVDLIRAVDNFVGRAPGDPRAAEALYRSGFVADQIGKREDARARYLRVFREYPASPWSEPALLAAVDSAVAAEKWEEASSLTSPAIAKERKLSEATASRLLKLREGANFKMAEQGDPSSPPEKKIEAYLRFRESFPASELAPKALFNAFVVAKQASMFDRGDAALRLLASAYPRSAEARRANYERALLLDALFEIDAAIAEYRASLSSALLPPKDSESALLRLIELLPYSGKPAKKDAEILAETRRLADPLRAETEFLSAASLEREGRPEEAAAIRASLAKRAGAPFRERMKAAAEMSRISWNNGDAAAARAWEEQTEELGRLLRKGDRGEVVLTLAMSRSARIGYERELLARSRIDGRSLRSLETTFRKKASSLAKLETAVLDLLKLHSVRAGASALHDLGLAYADFSEELKKLSPPNGSTPDEGAEFQRTLLSLTRPLDDKSKQAFEKSLELLAGERLVEPFADDLLRRLGRKEASVPTFWVGPSIPSPEDFFPSAIKIPPRDFWRPSLRQEASRALREELLARPGDTDLLLRLALFQIYEGRRDDFARSLAILETRLPADSLRRLRDLDRALRGEAVAEKEALDTARALLRASPASTRSHRAFAAALEKGGEKSKARFVLARALQIDPQDPLVASDYARLLDSPQDVPLRSSLLKKASESGHPESLANWGTSAFRTGRGETAIREWKEAFAASGGWLEKVGEMLRAAEPKKGGGTE
jgi:TolA-binding protein